MRHLHKLLDLSAGDAVQVSVTASAHVYLLDEANYVLYMDDEDFEYYGDTVRGSPYRLPAPRPGIWHLVIEQVDPAADLAAAVQIVSRE